MIPNFQLLTIIDSGYYKIDDTILVTPIQVVSGGSAKITVAHTTFLSNQSWSMRFWISEQPTGISISGLIRNSQSYASPLKTPQSFSIYDITSLPPDDASLLWATPVPANTDFWLNIQNVENRSNAFYMKVDYQAP